MLRGECPDEGCRAPVAVTGYEQSLACYSCGQDLSPQTVAASAIPIDDKMLPLPREITRPPRPANLVKVNGLCSYHQKLLSPLLTSYGMDKHSGKAKPLRIITGRPTLDCSVFGDRCFRLESRLVAVRGYGRDDDATSYLEDVLELTKPYNDDKINVVALQTDGDGHCLVHAVSRALVGSQLFWHPLRIGLKHHFSIHIEKYKSLLGNFIDSREWTTIIEECDPDYQPVDGSMVGLRNVHVFGLANLLRRPIILLDCLAGINASADYAGIFLPGLNPSMACSNKTGQLNPPICLAWSSAARNHYVPLVPFRDASLPRYPRHLLPKVWGFPQNVLEAYVKFDEQNCLTFGSENSLSESYIKRLVNAMDEQFLSLHGVPPSIVGDLFYYHYSSKLMVEPKAKAMVDVGATMLAEKRLLRCLTCRALFVMPLNSIWLKPNGHLYQAAKKVFGYLRENHQYTFNSYGFTCVYDSVRNVLVPKSHNMRCNFCQGAKLRTLRVDGSVEYQNGDVTFTRVTDVSKALCKCGYKHFWNGVEYDNPPTEIPIEMERGDRVVRDTIYWLHHESNPDHNTKMAEVVEYLLNRHFRDETDRESMRECLTEQLVQVTKELSDGQIEGDCGDSRIEGSASCSTSGGNNTGVRNWNRKRECDEEESGPPCKQARPPSMELELTPSTISPYSPGPSTSRHQN